MNRRPCFAYAEERPEHLGDQAVHLQAVGRKFLHRAFVRSDVSRRPSFPREGYLKPNSMLRAGVRKHQDHILHRLMRCPAYIARKSSLLRLFLFEQAGQRVEVDRLRQRRLARSIEVAVHGVREVLRRFSAKTPFFKSCEGQDVSCLCFNPFAMPSTDLYAIKLCTPDEYRAYIPSLAEILCECVNAGASVNFVLPFELQEAVAYWTAQEVDVTLGSLLLFVAVPIEEPRRAVGCVGARLAAQPNQQHRVDICKMLVHPQHRRQWAALATSSCQFYWLTAMRLLDV